MSSITFEEFSSDQPKPKNNALLVSAILSVFIHGILIHLYHDEEFSLLSRDASAPTVNLELKLVQEQSVRPLEKETSKVAQQKKIKPTETSTQTIESTEEELTKPQISNSPNKTENASEPEPKPESTATLPPKPEPKIDLLSIRESIGNQEIKSTIDAENSYSGSTYLNPVFGQRLEEQAQEESRRKRLEEAFQREKDNENYEFSVVGSTRVVRVDGVCWEAPVKTSMEEDPRIWTRGRDCSIKEKLDFSKRKQDLEYEEGKRDF